MSLLLDGTLGVPVTTVTGTLPEANGGTGTTVGYCGFKNKIINGGMVIDQRNAGASVTPASGNYTLDRWKFQATQSSKLTIQQSTVAPSGFSNSLLVTSTSAYSITSTDEFEVTQPVEGFNTADLSWGTASAQAVTLGFWVRSSLTGTFGGAIGNNAFNRSYPFSYTISAANTWEYKTVTIAGDTTGTWVGATNGIGLYVYFGLGVGSTKSGTAGSWAGSYFVSATGATSVVGTNGATFYITGVQLEKGSTATSFDYRPYGTELALCQRYYEVIEYIYLMFPWGSGTQVIRSWVNYKVTKRAAATFTFGTKIEGAGTLGVTSGGPSGITITGGGSFQDVVGYSSATASAEL